MRVEGLKIELNLRQGLGEAVRELKLRVLGRQILGVLENKVREKEETAISRNLLFADNFFEDWKIRDSNAK